MEGPSASLTYDRGHEDSPYRRDRAPGIAVDHSHRISTATFCPPTPDSLLASPALLTGHPMSAGTPSRLASVKGELRANHPVSLPQGRRRNARLPPGQQRRRAAGKRLPHLAVPDPGRLERLSGRAARQAERVRLRQRQLRSQGQLPLHHPEPGPARRNRVRPGLVRGERPQAGQPGHRQVPRRVQLVHR